MPEFTSPMMKLDLVALDQLAGLLDPGADVVRGVFDQEFERAAENAALGVDVVDRQPRADHFVLRHRGVDAGERIDHADLDRGFTAGGDDEGRRDLGGADRGAGLEQRAPIHSKKS